jgi:divalent metal cation (Fe/Co/Zn/Cd) transporter
MSAMVSSRTLDGQRRARLNRRSLHLAYATVGYNLAEGVVAVAAGAAASSTALIGFGLDSFIEVSSALVVIWQFRAHVPEARERVALRLIAVSFFGLAAWIGVDSVRSLLGHGEAEPSPVGIGLAASSVVVMPLLVWAKRRTGRELGSATVVADSSQTLLCTYLSATLLVGLILNAWLGWSWADPVAALIIAAVAVREGVEAWRGQPCDDCALPTAATTHRCGPGCGDSRMTSEPACPPANPEETPPNRVTRRARAGSGG